MRTENQWRAERIKVFEYLKIHVATASMVTEATGILQKNLTRHKRNLELAGKLWQLERKECKITGYKAFYLTTNENLITAQQATLFNDGQKKGAEANSADYQAL